MNKPLDAIGGVQGGPVRVSMDPGKPRNIHVSFGNPTAATHCAFLARSNREISAPNPTGGFPGFAIPCVANSVATATVGGVAYTNFLLQAWVGELWVAADAPGVLFMDVQDAGWPEK